MTPEQLAEIIAADRVIAVRQALAEDIGSGDITAQLIPAEQHSTARVITRENCIIAGTEWVDEVFQQLDPKVKVTWHTKDGAKALANDVLFELEGNARSLMTGERTALNFLQLLSGVATKCREYADLVEGTGVKLLDTRKTIPGLRSAQKYAVTCGGCYNHRIGLYDAFLIKENHIMACGGIEAAIKAAHEIAPGKPVEVEVENLAEFELALKAGADIIMLDEFSDADTRAAIQHSKTAAIAAKIEVSGNIKQDNLKSKSQPGVDYISIGALTKHCQAIDLSMRLRQY
ncbi:carboxylating nicotinate-nucleotide diphosphorylase [Simiduia curdlanivorans]|uniref:nicotinate-nucleotide diphosphorylase (carboxylating) n=1 Tax=Simiduia curdlanivorans TaxID=1492769 RepID=A0ABV8V876_9GAMM|nr:carboxylating nicotinate-nucleotide diphosphorylase [Simiduia curdlanivorans]MDN3638992.1 carboxylating nicotinate-nucleotide diphosphorylase [Simiduia curdlanivorans]